MLFNKLYPNVLQSSSKAFTSYNGDLTKEYEIFSTYRKITTRDDLIDWLSKNNSNQLIVNLDIDYFFSYADESEGKQIINDSSIIKLCQLLKGESHRIAVLTIALSPTCCGKRLNGWRNSVRISNLIAEAFGLKFHLEFDFCQ